MPLKSIRVPTVEGESIMPIPILASIGASIAAKVIPDLIREVADGRGRAVERVADTVSRVVTEATGLGPEASEYEVMRALEADPAAYARVKEAAADVAKAQIAERTETMQAAMADRASARSMQTRTQSRVPVVLIAVASLFAFVALGAVIYLTIAPVSVNSTMAAILGTAVGMAFSRLEQVFNFYFGSSEGSKKKTEIFEEQKLR